MQNPNCWKLRGCSSPPSIPLCTPSVDSSLQCATLDITSLLRSIEHGSAIVVTISQHWFYGGGVFEPVAQCVSKEREGHAMIPVSKDLPFMHQP